MTKKHFKLLAEEIKNLNEPITKRDVARLVTRVASQVNPNFSYDKFYKACGLH